MYCDMLKIQMASLLLKRLIIVLVNKQRFDVVEATLIPEPTARSAFLGVSPGRGLRRISIQCKMSRDRFLSSVFFSNTNSQAERISLAVVDFTHFKRSAR